jgi:hypothetical protein
MKSFSFHDAFVISGCAHFSWLNNNPLLDPSDTMLEECQKLGILTPDTCFLAASTEKPKPNVTKISSSLDRVSDDILKIKKIDNTIHAFILGDWTLVKTKASLDWINDFLPGKGRPYLISNYFGISVSANRWIKNLNLNRDHGIIVIFDQDDRTRFSVIGVGSDFEALVSSFPENPDFLPINLKNFQRIRNIFAPATVSKNSLISDSRKSPSKEISQTKRSIISLVKKLMLKQSIWIEKKKRSSEGKIELAVIFKIFPPASQGDLSEFELNYPKNGYIDILSFSNGIELFVNEGNPSLVFFSVGRAMLETNSMLKDRESRDDDFECFDGEKYIVFGSLANDSARFCLLSSGPREGSIAYVGIEGDDFFLFETLDAFLEELLLRPNRVLSLGGVVRFPYLGADYFPALE